MNLELSEDQTLLTDSFRRFFESESSIARVRAAEPLGYDPALWTALAEMGAFAMRLPGDDDMGLFNAALVMAEAGRHLASAPIAEAMVAGRLLATLGIEPALGARLAAGDAVVTLALRPDAEGVQIVSAGAVADAILFLSGDALHLAEQAEKPASPSNHGSMPIAPLVLTGADAVPSRIVASGPDAVAAYARALEEWKLLTAAGLIGTARRALELAADYAKERTQFGRMIGSYQAVAHPLADRIADVTGAEMLLWWTIRQIADGAPHAAAAIPMTWWWAAYASGEAVARALHTFGGYGLSLEYDVQLFHRRAKGTALLAGDPRDALIEAGRRLWLEAAAALPDAGDVPVDFDMGDAARALAEETRAYFEQRLTPEWHEKSHYSYDGHDWDLNRDMGAKGLLFPTWPEAYGGRGLDGVSAAAALAVWDDMGVTSHAQSVSNMVGHTIIRFGSDRLKADFLPALAAGEIVSCLGYSEPSSGSDVFAAQTRAVRAPDGSGDWIVNGQKMWTSGANLANHVLLLTRTNPDVPKHKGITLFVVPLNDPGVEIHAIHTQQEERTNATFYTDVRIPDAYRIGEVDGGTSVLGWALALEQGGGGFVGPHRHVVEHAVEWARGAGRIAEPRVLEKLAAAATRARVSHLLFLRSLWITGRRIPDRAAGPMSKLFSSETFLRDATELFDLTAPASLLHGKTLLGEIELAHRHAAATTIYAGTSEVHRSQVAENALGLPKSR